MTRDKEENKPPHWRPFIDPETGERQPGIYSGGKSDAIGSNTPSLKRPDSDFSRILVILREKPGLMSRQVADEFNSRHGTNKTIFTMQSKLGRLCSKGILIGKPMPGNLGKTQYFINPNHA